MEENHQQRKQGTLSPAGAQRLNRLELAGKQVDYIEHPRNTQMASHIYHQGNYIGGTLSIGQYGIIPDAHTIRDQGQIE